MGHSLLIAQVCVLIISLMISNVCMKKGSKIMGDGWICQYQPEKKNQNNQNILHSGLSMN